MRASLLAAALTIAAGSSLTQAATIYVSKAGDNANDGLTWATAKSTVTAGMSTAVLGDQVWVAAGIYVERVTLKSGVALYGGFAGTETQLIERNWASNVAVLDGSAAGTVVTVPSGAVAGTRVDGLTIRNGKGTNGGGLYCSGATVTVANNRFIGNAASTSGGGLFVTGSTSVATINNNSFVGNVASISGGSIYAFSGSVVIANNIIKGNTASATGTLNAGGGGIYYVGNQLIANNTLIGNVSPLGGGLYLVGAHVVANNVVAFNSSGLYRQGVAPTLRNNCVHNPDGANYTNLTAGTSDISVDPLLASADGLDVHLQATSPCINAGDDTVVQPEWVDMDGEPRIYITPVAHVDIGADEFHGTPPAVAPLVIRVSPAGSDNNDGSTWELAKQTVQAAIGTAFNASGGEVWVASGTYVERIALKTYVQVYGGFDGTETSREQRDWAVNYSILDGAAGGSVVTAVLGGHRTNRIDGFTIRNGTGTIFGSYPYVGGGIYCSNSNPEIAHNVITDNHLIGGLGAGVACVQSAAPLITQNTIRANVLNGGSRGGGGGIGCADASPMIVENIIVGNAANNGAGGAGIVCIDSSAVIARNAIRENQCSGDGGGGIACFSARATIANNLIGDNQGSGIVCSGDIAPAINNNVIVGNVASTASFLSTKGGGIACFSSAPIVTNNTIVRNAAMRGGGLYCESVPLPVSPTLTNNILAFNSSGIYNTGATPILQNNCVYQPGGNNYWGLAAGTSDISVDPMLVADEFGEVHVTSGSPCIDAGLDSAVLSGWLDLDGEARLQGTHVDIGADEFNGAAPGYTPLVIHVSPSGNDANDGLSWEGAKLTVQAGIDAAAGPTGEVWVAEGTYQELITLRPWVGLYGGFAGTEASRDDRDWVVHVTVLDGQSTGRVVTTTPCGVTGRVDGFTIQNGKGTGGGIYCYYGSPTIANNTITGGTAVSVDAIGCEHAAPLIIGNTLRDNGWAGVYTSSGAPVIVGNVILRNLTGGILCNDSFPTIAKNTIVGNGIYGGINCTDFLVISANVIAQNTGGGISAGTGTIVSNQVVGNSLTGKGGGIRCHGSTKLINNIVAFNSSGVYREGGSPTSDHNCVYNPAGFDYDDVIPGTGDISADPLFVDLVAGDYRLRAGSPCIDAGINAAVVEAGLLLDFDGRPRFIINDPATPDCQWAPGTCGTAPIVDMGAFEFIAGDYDYDGDLDLADLAIFQACFSGPSVMYAGDCLASDLDGDGDVDSADFGVFQRCFTGADQPVNPDCTR